DAAAHGGHRRREVLAVTAAAFGEEPLDRLALSPLHIERVCVVAGEVVADGVDGAGDLFGSSGPDFGIEPGAGQDLGGDAGDDLGGDAVLHGVVAEFLLVVTSGSGHRGDVVQ